LYEKVNCPVTEIKNKLQKRIPLSHSMPSISEELLLLGLWNYPDVLERVGPTLPVAIVSGGYNRQFPVYDLLPGTKLIYMGNEPTHVTEKNSVLLWMFEQHSLFAINAPSETVLEELTRALNQAYEEETGCELV
jgi:hypothetical protein